MSGFIVFEGADGVGTTTQALLLADHLRWLVGNENVKYTSEPTDFCIGKLIREILYGKEKMPLNSTMELLFRADRINHVENKIKPWLSDNKWVVSDRYFPSTLVYQGMGDDISHSLDTMKKMFDRFVEEDGIILPDVTIVLDADIEVCQNRIKNRGNIEEIYEGIDFQHKVRHLYLEWVNSKWDIGNKNKKIIVNAKEMKEKVHESCLKALEEGLFSVLGINWDEVEK